MWRSSRACSPRCARFGAPERPRWTSRTSRRAASTASGGLQPWDVAAGQVIVREAGGTITGADGGPYRLGDEVLVASNGALHARLVDALDLTSVLWAQEGSKRSVDV